MRRGTTPTISIQVDGFTFQGCQVLLTIRQDKDDIAYPPLRKRIFPIIVEKSGQDVEVSLNDDGKSCIISATLTQKQTLGFVDGMASVQLRWIDENGIANGSRTKKINITPILTDGVIEYGQQSD